MKPLACIFPQPDLPMGTSFAFVYLAQPANSRDAGVAVFKLQERV